MKYLLDTNVCVDYLNGRFPSVTERFQRSLPQDLCISSVVMAELRYGADRSASPQLNHRRLDVLTLEIASIDFDLAAASAYGKVRAALEAQGSPIGANDMLIAAQALALGVVLVTDNVREFERVEGLEIENWRR
jgi:tRNA(fMet)-specific endonuclease VapC